MANGPLNLTSLKYTFLSALTNVPENVLLQLGI
jgi:hypothetical protein